MPFRAIPIVLKVTFSGVVLGAIVAFFHQIPAPETPSLWPVSIGGWLALSLAGLAFADAVHRRLNDPVEKAAKAEREAREAMEKRLNEKLEGIVVRIEQSSRDTTRLREIWEVRMRAVEDTARDARRDTVHLEETVDDYKGLFDKMYDASERHNENVLKGLTRIAGGVRGMLPGDLHQ